MHFALSLDSQAAVACHDITADLGRVDDPWLHNDLHRCDVPPTSRAMPRPI